MHAAFWVPLVMIAATAFPASEREPAGAYVPPVPGAVLHAFDPPAEEWTAGHRGIDLAAGVGDGVASPGPGLVTFAGQVGGKRVVVVTHAGGLRSTLEPVDASVDVGTTVAGGETVGTLAPAPATGSNPGHCAPDDCLHWGVRRGDVYLDPLTLVGDAPPIVLLPLEG
jgi:murein DD-endopeptidase MepM/ murein hydrolase activator NlpD